MWGPQHLTTLQACNGDSFIFSLSEEQDMLRHRSSPRERRARSLRQPDLRPTGTMRELLPGCTRPTESNEQVSVPCSCNRPAIHHSGSLSAVPQWRACQGGDGSRGRCKYKLHTYYPRLRKVNPSPQKLELYVK
jgi:hypothetical protein